MRAYVQISGLDETISAFKQFDEQLPDAIQASLQEGTQDVSEALGNYPSQEPSQAKKPRAYVRTMAYQQNQVISYTDMTSTVETPTPYAVYLRGDDSGGGQSWFHTAWESITSIVDRLQSQIEDIFNRRIEGLIYRIFGQ